MAVFDRIWRRTRRGGRATIPEAEALDCRSAVLGFPVRVNKRSMMGWLVVQAVEFLGAQLASLGWGIICLVRLRGPAAMPPDKAHRQAVAETVGTIARVPGDGPSSSRCG